MAVNSKKKINEDFITRSMLNTLRNKEIKLSENRLLKEETDKEYSDAIAITNDPKFGQQVLKNQESAFRSNVDSGAQFNDENAEHPGENPLIFIPSERNLIFSGRIPSMNGLNFQFVLNDSEGIGAYVWIDGQSSGTNYLRLTDNNLKNLQKIRGYYEIWSKNWNESSSMFDNLLKKD